MFWQPLQQLKKNIYTLYLIYPDPRTPWYAKLGIALVVGYALSPIDLIPDFIPVLGYLDDLILLPLGISIVIKITPPALLEEYRQSDIQPLPHNWLAASVIIAGWIGLSTWLIYS